MTNCNGIPRLKAAGPAFGKEVGMDGPRACREEDFEETVALVNAVFREGTDQDIRTDYPLVFNADRMHYMRIIRVDGKVVAHVPVAPRGVLASGDRFIVGIISPTATHPAHRRRSYGTRCLRDCVRLMEENGWPVSALWTLEETFPFYRNSGWEAVSSQGWVYHLTGWEHELFKAGEFDIVPFDPGELRHLEAVEKLHNAEPCRIARSRAEYLALFTLPKIRTFLARRAGETVSYLMFGEGRNKPGLIEAGGDIKGLEALVRHVLLELAPAERIQVVTPSTPTVLQTLMERKKPGTRRPVEVADGVSFQMMRVNSLEGLLRRIENHLRGKAAGLTGAACLKCRESGEAVTLKFGAGEVEILSGQAADPVELTRRQLAQLIFGGHSSGEPVQVTGAAGRIVRKVFPYYFPIWELDHS